MADIAARDELRAAPPARPRASERTQAQSGDRTGQPPRTDVGTLVLHWATASAFVVSLFTGIRIAADALHAPVSKWLSPILPQGEIWTFHFYAGLTLFFCAAAYFIYMRRAGLASRNALKKTRVMVMPVAAKMRFGGLNVLLHWVAYVIVLAMTITGVFLYLGQGGSLGQMHSYIAVPGLAASDTLFQDKLVIRRIATAPDPNKLLSDPVWADVAPVLIHTQQGINLGGTGESLVEVRAVHDGKKAYFAFHWEDPTRSVRREPLIKKEDGWHIIADNTYTDDVTTFYEDKFAVIFSSVNDFGNGGESP